MKNTIYVIIAFVIAVLAVFGYRNFEKANLPQVAEDGSLSGEYSLESIMSLGKPYECSFGKSDENSKVVGVVHTDSKNAYGEFRVSTSLSENEFNNFLLIKDGEAYVWASLNQTAGYKSKVARRASSSRVQIIGLADKATYDCKLWQNPDETLFDPPTWISFQEI